MENGEWRMENGEWGENGELRIENGELLVADEPFGCFDNGDQQLDQFLNVWLD